MSEETMARVRGWKPALLGGVGGAAVTALVAGLALASGPDDKGTASDGHVWTDVDAGTRLLGELAPLPSLAPMVEKLEPVVVNIYTTQKVHAPQLQWHGAPGMGQDVPEEFKDFFHRFAPPMEPGDIERQSLGSGFVLSADGFIVTNNHVVEDASEIKVRLSTGKELPATLVGADGATDIALLRVKSDEPLQHVVTGDSDEVRVGDQVVAIGNPFGLSHTVTAGIVSAKARAIGAGPYDDFIQTDASINPGNSGGPLFDMRGAVVGMNTAIIRQANGIGFAVPINVVKDVVARLATDGKVSRGWLGVGIQPLTPELARGMGLVDEKGAVVSQVFPDGPADDAGIRPGDVVVSFEGRPVDDAARLTRLVGAAEPGSKAKVVVLRDGARKELGVMLGTRAGEDELAQGMDGQRGERRATSDDRLGVRVEAVPRSLGSARGAGGVRVAEVDPSGPAAKAGVRPGDVILRVDRRTVTSPSELADAVKAAPADREVVLLVQRGNSNLWVAVPPRK